MMRIGEAAKTLGICPGTLRNIERRGVVSIARDQAGHRRFSEADLQVLGQIIFSRSISTEESSNEEKKS